MSKIVSNLVSNLNPNALEGTMSKLGRLATSLIVASACLVTVTLIGCGDDGESEAPACRDGNCDTGGTGGSSGSNCGGLCQAPASCNSITQQCVYNNSACSSCGSGTWCDTSTSPPSCKSVTNPGSCGSTCGLGTVCSAGKCVPGSGGSPDSCGGACGSGTHCVSGTCVANSGTGGSGGTGGTGGTGGSGSGGSKLADVTWKPKLSSSTIGYVDATLTSDGSFTPGQTVSIYTSDGSSAVCAILYGAKNVLICSDACEWWSVYKPVFAPMHGQNADNTSYTTSLQAAKDAAADMLSCRNSGSGACSSEFVWRAANNSGGAWEDNEPAADSQSQIACAYVPASGVVETH